MTEFEIVRVVIEVLGVLGAVLVVSWRVSRAIVHEIRVVKDGLTVNTAETRAVKEQLLRMNGTIAVLVSADMEQDRRIAWLTGRLDLPMDAKETPI